MKKLSFIAAGLLMTLAANAATLSPYQDKNYNDWGKLKLVDNQLSSMYGEPVQLKGWSTYLHDDDHVQDCLGAGKWSNMKQYGASAVRLAISIDGENSYLSNPKKFKDLVKQSIDECKELDMYVVVDWHILGANGDYVNPNDYLKEAKDFFAEISEYCKDKKYDHVLYELCNEPTCGWANIKTYAEAVIPVITVSQPHAIIIVGTDLKCQKIMEPVTNPIDTKYKKNVMYSFHYSACSHYHLLGDFRNAQKNIPVFVSEWSAVKSDGSGPFCSGNADRMIAACDMSDVAPQVVSWCLWNWGKKDDATSFYKGSCNLGNESSAPGIDHDNYGYYVRELMAGEVREVDMPETGPWTTLNQIPSKLSAAWHWDYYDLGGEGVAYHDGNGGAWIKDEDDVVIDYDYKNEEVDVFSLAYDMQWLDKKCPWSTVEDGKVVAWDPAINTIGWKDADGNPTYRALNGGRNHSGTDGSCRPDEGVDLSGANCKGTDYWNSGYCNLGWVEEGEWINYTVKVAKPGYYKIAGVISSEYKANGDEISIVSDYGNHLRIPSDLTNANAVKAFGFDKTTKCDDPSAEVSDPWDCWSLSDAKSGKNKEIYCAFGYIGIQPLTIRFNGDAGGVGPLIFEFVKDIDWEDPANGPIYCGCGDNWFYDHYDYPTPDEEDDDKGDDNAVRNINCSVRFKIFPNPTAGEFNIELAKGVKATVDVVNMAGRVVASQIVDGTATINKALTPGVYTVVVKSEGAVGTQKLMVK